MFASQPPLFDDPDAVLGKIAADMGVAHDRFEAIIRDPGRAKGAGTRGCRPTANMTP